MPSVLDLYETFDSRSMKANTDRDRDYVRTFDVVVDSRLVSPDLILFATGVPRRWSPYISAAGTVDLLSLCKEVEAKQDTQDPYLWKVVARYSNKVNRQDIHQEDNPLLRPADIEWDTTGVMRPAVFDRDGEAILNSSLERYDPPLEREEKYTVVKIVRNQLLYNQLEYQKYINCVNKTTWFSQLRGRVKCADIKAKLQFEAGFYFFSVTFLFHVRVQFDEEADTEKSEADKALDAWAFKALDQGYHKLRPDLTQERILIRGVYPTSPVLLDGAGGVLAAGGDPVFNTHHIYPEKDFTPLLLP